MNFFGICAQPLGWCMTWLYDLIGNYGITLVVLTLIVKALLYPIYKKQIMSTMGMSDMQPKMQAIQRKYANDKELQNQKIQELYKEEGVNPLAGCLPMIVQMIIIMGLFTLLRNPLNYVASERMYFAIHESFFWINDLAQPDPWILPILSGVATFASFYLSQQNGVMPGQTANTGAGMMKVMGNKTLIFSINLEAIAMMPCNPSIGGTGKGHLVREIDALGGEMGVNIDKTFIQSRMLNTAKGPAVHSLRAQADKHRYHTEMKKTIEKQENLDMKQDEVIDIMVEDGRVCGVMTRTHACYRCKAVVLATGTFLRGKIFIGDSNFQSGPNGLAPSVELADNLVRHAERGSESNRGSRRP